MTGITNILSAAWNIMALMAPYLLLGFFVAGLLGAFVPAALIEKHLGKRGLWQIVKASLFGVPIPLCSCSVIPVITSLRRHGATPGATLSFLTSTPQTGVDSIAATWGLLGPVFTVFRVVVAFVTGVLCGVVVEACTLPDNETNTRSAEQPHTSCCAKTKKQPWKEVFTYGFGVLPRDIGRALLLGILISGLLGALVPADFFVRYINSEWLSMIAVMALGIPLYVCSTGSIPIALAMISMGLSPGAALVFLITGPATNAATLTTVIQTMGRRVVLIYLLTLAAVSLAAGWLLNRVLPSAVVQYHIEHHTEVTGSFETTCGILLAGLLLYAMLPRKKKSCCKSA